MIGDDERMILRAALLLLYLAAFFLATRSFVRGRSHKSEPTNPLSWWQHLEIIVCTGIATYPSTSTFWAKISQYPMHLSADFHSGLPPPLTAYSQTSSYSELLAFFVADLGRPSYLYNVLLLTLGAIPEINIFIVYVVLLSLQPLFVYLLFRAAAVIASPALLLFLLCFPADELIVGSVKFNLSNYGLQKIWIELLDTFYQCRSWSTELVALAVALCFLAPKSIQKSGWGLGGALLGLGFAAMDNPYHLVHLVGFFIGSTLYFISLNLSQSGSRQLLKHQKRALLFTVVIMLALIGPVVSAVGVDADASVTVEWSTWLTAFHDNQSLYLYLLPLGLAWWGLPREWYPLLGVAVVGGAITVTLPLFFADRTLVDPYRYLRSTLPIMIFANYGLLCFYTRRLLRKAIATNQPRNSAFTYSLLWTLSLGVGVTTWPNRMQRCNESLKVRLLFCENGKKIYERFAATGPEAPRTFLTPNITHELADLVTLATPYENKLPPASIASAARGSWNTQAGTWTSEVYDCDSRMPAVLVGTSLEFEDADSPVLPCGRCTPEDLTMLDYRTTTTLDNSSYGAAENPQDPSRMLYYQTPTHPYIVWHCPAIEAD
jgi:hypothetical protein